MKPLMSLELLPIFATEKSINRLSVFGDSMNVINWIKQTQECRHIILANLLSSTRMVLQSFNTFSCRHVYRVNNKKADQASKEGVITV